MAKLRDRKKLRWCLRQFEEGKATQVWLSKYLEVTPRWFRQIYSIYKKIRGVPTLGSNVGRPRTKISDEQQKVVEEEWRKHRLNALYLETSLALNRKREYLTIQYIKSCLKKALQTSKKASKTSKPLDPL